MAEVTKPIALDETLQATNTALGLLGKDTTLQSIVTALASIGVNTVGNLASLVTTDKTSLVGAVNEVAGDVDDIDEAKADKVDSATSGNLASLDANGNLVDSGWKSDKTTTAVSGNPISISGLKSNQLAKDPIITLEPIQAGSGTPSPSNVRAISGYDKIEVLSCGKNLFDKSKVELGSIDQTTGEDTPSTTVYRTKGFIRVKPSTEYRIQGFNEAMRVFLYSDAELISSSVYYARYSIVFPANVTRIRMQSSNLNNFKDTLQVEQSASYTDYAPYHKTTDLSESIGQTVYGGSLDVRTGKLLGKYISYTFTGNETVTAYGQGWYVTTGLSFLSTSIISEKFKSADYTDVYNGRVDNSCCVANGDNGYIGFYKSGASANDIKTLITGMKLVCELATPYTIQLTPHEISILKDYAYISTNGTNISLDYHNGELASLADVSQLGETVNELGEYISASTFGIGSAITLSTDYTIPSDGYVVLNCGYPASEYIMLKLNGKTMQTIRNADNGGNNGPNYACVFVRKGMIANVAGSVSATATFYPLC